MNLEYYIFRYLPNILYCGDTNYVKQQWFCYKWVRKHLKWSKEEIPCSSIINENVVIDESIFLYWKQGWDNAPILVRKCMESVQRNHNGHPLVLLDGHNIHEYVRLPDYIEKYHDEGKIKEAMYSDMLRITLLENYGGYWMDATCFLSSPVPRHIEECDFFMFSKVLLPEWSSPIKGSNWFIHSKQGNQILHSIRNFLFNYWRHKDFLVNYYIFHIALAAIIDNDSECNRMWSAMPYICNMNPHVLQYSLANEYKAEIYDSILQQCFIHKLTYKYNQNLLRTDIENNLQHILKN